jgi:hypothetical protein
MGAKLGKEREMEDTFELLEQLLRRIRALERKVQELEEQIKKGEGK